MSLILPVNGRKRGNIGDEMGIPVVKKYTHRFQLDVAGKMTTKGENNGIRVNLASKCCEKRVAIYRISGVLS
jgi:hypothetical protein